MNHRTKVPYSDALAKLRSGPGNLLRLRYYLIFLFLRAATTIMAAMRKSFQESEPRPACGGKPKAACLEAISQMALLLRDVLGEANAFLLYHIWSVPLFDSRAVPDLPAPGNL